MKLSDNEIIKALENLTYGGHSCGKCKHQVKKGDEKCGIKGCNIARNALDLINRLKAENERVEKELMKCNLEKEMLHQIVEEIESEAIKEFVAKLKKEALKHKIFPFDSCVDFDDINNLVKEMTE